MAENGTDVILDEISGDEIQSVLDTLMGNSSISFMDYVACIALGGHWSSYYEFFQADAGKTSCNNSILWGVSVTVFGINRCIYAGINAGSADVIRIVRVYQGADTGVFHQYEFCKWSRSGGGIL